MTEPAIGAVIPKRNSGAQFPAVDNLGAFGRRIEELGYESIWTSEGWGSDSIVDLTTVAAHTNRVRLGTSVVNVFTRTPAGLAMAMASLDRVSDGRAVVGIGAGHPRMVEDLHDIPYERPLRRIHETVELLRRFLGDEAEVTYDGELFQVEGFSGLDSDVAIYNAALGETNRRVAGRFSDGWIPYHIPFSQLESAFEVVANAARDAGRNPADLAVTPFVPAAVGDDAEAARNVIRRNVASYVGKFTDESYRNVVASAYPNATQQIASRWREGDEAAATEAVTDEMVDDFGVAGTPEQARKRLGEIASLPTVDVPLLVVPHGAYDDVGERTFTELSPSRL